MYNLLASRLGKKEASQYLLSKGFDGIEYPISSKSINKNLDIKGEKNYVFFDTNKLSIEDKK